LIAFLAFILLEIILKKYKNNINQNSYKNPQATTAITTTTIAIVSN